MNLPPLTTLVPVRDRRDRTVGYVLLSAPSGDAKQDTYQQVHDVLDLLPSYSRMAARSLMVPVIPAVVHDGSLTRFASLDVVYLVATESLEDRTTRRAIERLAALGIRFAFDGFTDDIELPRVVSGAILALDARGTPPVRLSVQLRTATEAGLQPLIRGVDDRATRLRVLNDGAAFHMGVLLGRRASTPVEPQLRRSIVQTLLWLAEATEGRPMDTSVEQFVRTSPHASAALLKVVGSAAVGVGTPRSVQHAMTLLGRDTVLDLMSVVAARLLGEAAGDPELAATALRRVRLCERIGSALDNAPQPRARAVGALLSVTEYALSAPPCHLQQQDFAALAPSYRDAMVDRTHPLGKLLDLVESLEFGWWSDVRSRCLELGVHPGVLATAYADAFREARDDLAMPRDNS